MKPLFVSLSFASLFPSNLANAAELNGAAMKLPWLFPFVGMLLTIAVGPMLFRKFWHRHYGKLAALWSVLTLLPLALVQGFAATFLAFMHTALAEYMSFIILLLALYVTAGGTVIEGELRGTPWTNACILGFGSVIASLIGTTGATMVLVRPLIRANAGRRSKAHVLVFFIILVGNLGGALSPLGDPPLLIGYLHGVDFFWPVKHLWLETLLAVTIVLAIFLVLDIYLGRGQAAAADVEWPRVRGSINLVLLLAIVAILIVSTFVESGASIFIFGAVLEVKNLVRDAALFGIVLLSLWLTREEYRVANDFTWEPIREVAFLFAGIFVCIIPVLAMLEAGDKGTFAPVLAAVTFDGKPHPAAFFWITGLLSAFLDNAPTYLVSFQLAGGNPTELMGPFAPTLAAISMGAVYMGALTYVGNAPNLMVAAIAEERGIRMPSFFGYMFWSGIILLPIFLLITFASFGGL